MIERIPADGWQAYAGHVDRYRWAGSKVRPGERVNDVACGVGYGAALLGAVDYHGYDRPGVPDGRFPGAFHAVDLDDPAWRPGVADVTVCFETLEHVADPHRLAAVLAATTRRLLLVSTPTQPTRHFNPWHRHDFTFEEVPPMFTGWRVAQWWAQPAELCHAWALEPAA